ncbi:unnamed protein product [Tuber melanosporum]|uniref:(Perigord truffle) hypothetical protein n=1 Tax=Tuber melanosporum (strain Mel28) TaxID=656061 RepID=D5G3Z5_TUBMM|nr:uncharacterized protein GSTUM_00003876001 [Tuber melanosporum]CAZ79238.1 unnamed protein product [Tuber melanosporum]
MHPGRRHVQMRRSAAVIPISVPFKKAPTITLKGRADTTSDASGSTSTCKDGDTSSRCEKPAGATNSTLPIILGSMVPIFIAVLVLVWLHRRHTQKLKREDAMDKTKSMDFGLDIGPASKYSVNGATPGGEKSTGNGRRQLSMDIGVNSPYLLPAGIHGSKESLHSLARSGDDRYGRPMTADSRGSPSSPLTHVSSPWSDANSRHLNHNNSNNHDRDSSHYGPSTGHDDSPDGSQMSMTAELLSGAQRMPTSTPPRSTSLPKDSPSNVPRITVPTPAIIRSPAQGSLVNNSRDKRDSYGSGDDLHRSHVHMAKQVDYVQQPALAKVPDGLAAFRAGQSTSGPLTFPQFEITSNPSPDGEGVGAASDGQTEQKAPPTTDDQSDYGDGIQFRLTTTSESGHPQAAPVSGPEPRKSLAPGAFDNRRLSMGFRPLPPDGNPDDTAEERAMRIRSFYKEYFEDSTPAPPMPNILAPEDYPGYGQDYYDDSAPVYDHDTGRYQIPGAKPFAEPPTRRAMTPPPRMPPRFNSGPQSRAGSAAGGRFMPPGLRSFSSASGFIPSGRPPPHRRPIAPPQPLNILPTPHLLNEDAFASPIMFAPPSRVPGSDSGGTRGGRRPYSPSVSPHVPLVSAFDELAVLPTPHLLRNSSTFTALDFAPPRKFREDGGIGSDAGSIRSNKSGVSALQVQNIRNGAYRVSRLPQDVVPVKEDMTSNLKPTWVMRP